MNSSRVRSDAVRCFPRGIPSRAHYQRSSVLRRSSSVFCLVSFAALVFLGLAPARAHASLVINELMASNAAGAADPQGEFDDWIEIHNTGAVPVDLAGMYLTDDRDDPMKWQIPADDPSLTVVPALGYVVIWADKDTADAGLHADFALSAGGETLALFDTDGQTVLDRVSFPPQRSDLSYARYPDGEPTWGYAVSPTPGGANAELYEGIVADPTFDGERGFYDEPFELTITCATSDAVIYYSLDATGPNRVTEDWPTAQVYSGPLHIAATTCVRARALRPGWHRSRTQTHTYLFPADVVAQSAMSPAITHDAVWGPQLTDALREIPTISLVTPKEVGEEQDVETSIEMIFPDGSEGFQADAGLRYAGGIRSAYDKRSFGVRFKGFYGVPSLRFDLFGAGGAREFDQVILRCGSHDTMFWTHRATGNRGIYIRNRWASDRQLEMGHPAPRGRFVHLYWNGTYWGKYQLMERPNAAFMASYFGGDAAEYDALNGGEAVDGTADAWNALLEVTDDYAALQQYLDPINYADYMLLNFYGGNDWDWAITRNWRAARLRAEGAGFQFFAWDNDVMLRLGVDANCLDRGGPGNMWSAVSSHAPFRRLFADRVQKFLCDDGMLTPDRVTDQFDELAGRIERTLIAECARWGVPKDYTPETWRTHLDLVMTEILPQRTAVVIQQLRDAGVFPAIDAPTFFVNDLAQHGGAIERTDGLAMAAPEGTVYYTLDGSDPRRPDDVATAFESDLATGLSPTAIPYTSPVTLTESGPVKARAWVDGTWSALNEAVFALGPVAESLRISEIMYHPTEPNTEYIELTNIGAETLSLNLIRFTEGVDFTFPSLDLAPGDCVLVVADVAAFEAEYGSGLPVAGCYAGALSNAGERLLLQDAAGRTIQDVTYDDGWHDVTDGDGFSLTAVDPTASDSDTWSDEASWRPSLDVGGTPGYAP